MVDQLIAQSENTKTEIQQLENRVKRLAQAYSQLVRKERTRRLIERGAILESMIVSPEIFSNEDIKLILTAALKSEAASAVMLSIRKQQSEGTDATRGTGV